MLWQYLNYFICYQSVCSDLFDNLMINSFLKGRKILTLHLILQIYNVLMVYLQGMYCGIFLMSDFFFLNCEKSDFLLNEKCVWKLSHTLLPFIVFLILFKQYLNKTALVELVPIFYVKLRTEGPIKYDNSIQSINIFGFIYYLSIGLQFKTQLVSWPGCIYNLKVIMIWR